MAIPQVNLYYLDYFFIFFSIYSKHVHSVGTDQNFLDYL